MTKCFEASGMIPGKDSWKTSETTDHQIPTSLEKLHSKILNLQETVKQLEVRLSTVMRPLPPTDVGLPAGNTVESIAPMAYDIRETSYLVDLTLDVVNDMLDRLEV